MRSSPDNTLEVTIPSQFVDHLDEERQRIKRRYSRLLREKRSDVSVVRELQDDLQRELDTLDSSWYSLRHSFITHVRIAHLRESVIADKFRSATAEAVWRISGADIRTISAWYWHSMGSSYGQHLRDQEYLKKVAARGTEFLDSLDDDDDDDDDDDGPEQAEPLPDSLTFHIRTISDAYWRLQLDSKYSAVCSQENWPQVYLSFASQHVLTVMWASDGEVAMVTTLHQDETQTYYNDKYHRYVMILNALRHSTLDRAVREAVSFQIPHRFFSGFCDTQTNHSLRYYNLADPHFYCPALGLLHGG